jgi:hypothetical protein
VHVYVLKKNYFSKFKVIFQSFRVSIREPGVSFDEISLCGKCRETGPLRKKIHQNYFGKFLRFVYKNQRN